MKDVVAPSPADPGHHVLVPQVGMEAARARAGPDERGELRRVRLWAEPRQRSVIALGQNPPRCLALGAELTDQQREIVIESESGYGAARSGPLGWDLYVEPARLRKMHHNA